MRELLQKALFALNEAAQFEPFEIPDSIFNAIEEIEAALAQPEEKPYGYALERHDGAVSFFIKNEDAENHFKSPEYYAKLALYLHPNSQTERKPLTTRQIKDMTCEGVFLGSITEIVRAIEAAHGIKE